MMWAVAIAVAVAVAVAVVLLEPAAQQRETLSYCIVVMRA